MAAKLKVAESLVQQGNITQQQLEQAVQLSDSNDLDVGEALVQLGFVEVTTLLQQIAKQMDMPFVDLRQFEFNKKAVELLPENHAKLFRAIVLNYDEKDPLPLTVGMADPENILAIDELKRILKHNFRLALINADDLPHAFNLVYRRTNDISSFAQQLEHEILPQGKVAGNVDNMVNVDAPVIKLIQSIFEDAVQVGASDIHIEPTEDGLRIRQRVDGVLQGHIIKEKNIASALTQRLKLMSDLDIAEKRLPQDGRFSIKVKSGEIDVRISTLPTPLGETVVMRLLVPDKSLLGSLENIGLPDDMFHTFKELVLQPHGVLLVTGPTGSGKSTTLYSVLHSMDAEKEKIITIEDPIESYIPNIVQTQVQSKVGLSFAQVLRTTLRQDPDILMVGEIRDEETASIAMRAALTGHMVFSTLHTNDSASTAIRLLDMGIEGFLVASTLLGVLAQRLARRVCKNCRQPYQLNDREKAFLDGIADGKYLDADYQYGKGCSYCNHSGYKGRVGIFELLTLNGQMMDALRANQPSEFSNLAEASLKGSLLLDRGLQQASQGEISVSEVMRLVGT